MKALKTILLVIFGIVILLVVAAYLLPRHINVERSGIIPAQPEVVFEQVNTLKNWEDWSPWHNIDPEMVIVYEGPEMGIEASYSWHSNNPKAGRGKLTIVESNPSHFIKTEIDFFERGKSYSNYTFEEIKEGTLMTWAMDVDMGNNPIGRYLGLFMDKLLGNDFEAGINNLTEVVSALPEQIIDE